MSIQATTLRLAVLPRRGLLAEALVVLAGAGLIAASAVVSIPLPFTPVPVTGSTFGVLLVGAGLGTSRGASAAMLYALAGIAGAPVFAGGAHGWAVITGASGGYIVAYPFAAALAGFLAERRWDRRFSSAIGAVLTGNVVFYLFGLPWLAAVAGTNLEKTFELGLYPFVAGDMVKLYLAAALLPTAWRLVPRREPPAGRRPTG
jgi:biotin transport system substrate-specific component